MDRAVGERRSQRGVDEAVLVDQRQANEALAHDRDVEVVSATGAVDDLQLHGLGKRFAKEPANGLARH